MSILKKFFSRAPEDETVLASESPFSNQIYLEQSEYWHIIIFGEARDYMTALISPNYDTLKSIAINNKIQYNSVEELVVNSLIIQKVKKDIDYHQSSFAKYERVRKKLRK